MNNTSRVIEGIDFDLLRKQKQDLLSMPLFEPTIMETVEGVVNPLDELQDAIVADGIRSEVEVFGEEETK